jgi:hypothetical protein
VLCANPSQQPTDFWLDTYTISEVFDTPDLVTSLAQYSEQLQDPDHKRPEYYTQVQSATSASQSILFLRIQAAASYYSANRTLMEHPEPVDVDISMLTGRNVAAAN